MIACEDVGEHRLAFWYTTDRTGKVVFDDNWFKDYEFGSYTDHTGTGYPDVGYIVNMEFRKISDGGSDNNWESLQ